MGSGETDILKQEYKVDGKMTYLFIMREYTLFFTLRMTIFTFKMKKAVT